MGALDGKVALITGAARGQGRAYAIRMAAEGADIVALDACGPVAPVGYPPATSDDLAETVAAVEATGRRIVSRVADVRDQAALDDAVAAGEAAFGAVDIAVANAGVSSWGRLWEMSEHQWSSMIDINLSGAWRTFKAVVPGMIARGRGGALVAISSVAGLKALPGQSHYSASKHGLVGLVNAAAVELGEHGIRVNSVHPWAVDTAMMHDPGVPAILEANPRYMASFASVLTEPAAATCDDLADAVLWLVSDAARCVTGVQLPVDLGATKV